MTIIETPLQESDIRRLAGPIAYDCAIHVLQETASTNSWLLEHGEPLKTSMCIAERQVAGKGRRGRQWQSEGGSFTCSIRVPLQVSLSQAGAFSLVVAISLRDALGSLGVSGVGVKWPNDLLHDWRKLSGVLLEVATNNDHSVDLVCGAGVNWRATHQAVDQPLVDVHAINPDVQHDRNFLAGSWLANILEAKTRFEQQGFESFAAEWQACDLLDDSPVTVLRGEERIEGIARGVDVNGALKLQTDRGIQLLHAGEVSLRRR